MDNSSIILQQNYQITAKNIDSQEGGWSALAYQVTTASGRFFLKIYEKSSIATAAWTAHINDYMPILVWLNETTLLKGRIPRPLLTIDGNYKVEDEQRIYILFDYIDGMTIAEQDLTDSQVSELARIIAELHAFGADIPYPTSQIREDFAVPFCAKLKHLIDHDRADYPADLLAILTPHLDKLAYFADQTETLAAQMKAASPDMRLCHTDAHGWNLMQSQNLMLIDWEGLKLAPVEADLFMFYDKPYWELFLSTYREKHKDFAISADVMNFYLYRRKLEDIWEFIDRILHDPITPELRDKAMQLLKQEFNEIGSVDGTAFW